MKFWAIYDAVMLLMTDAIPLIRSVKVGRDLPLTGFRVILEPENFIQMNKIIVLWTEAIRLEDVSMSSYAGNCGLYQILVMEENNSENERLIYLGKTNSTFLRRICQHLSGTGGSGTFLKVKGKKFIRFGLIPRPFKCSDKTYRRMLDHAEAVDIEMLHPELNKKAGYRIPEYSDVPVVNWKISDLLNQNVI